MQPSIPHQLDVPEDVLAEMDVEERRRHAAPPAPVSQPIPEEVLSELDQEARRASEQERTQLSEGTPPAASDEDAPST